MSRRGFEVRSTCSNCGKPVSRSASVCPHCGVKFYGEKWMNQSSSTKNFTSKHLAIILILIFIVLLFGYFFANNDWGPNDEIYDVQDYSKALFVGDDYDNKLGGATGVYGCYGYDSAGNMTDDYEKIVSDPVYIGLDDFMDEVNVTEFVDSFVDYTNDRFTRINDTSIEGKHHNYTFVDVNNIYLNNLSANVYDFNIVKDNHGLIEIKS